MNRNDEKKLNDIDSDLSDFLKYQYFTTMLEDFNSATLTVILEIGQCNYSQ